MHYCPFCRRINSGRPIHCRFCGRTWYIRLCPRGHENPRNALRCGECGSAELSETVGRRLWLVIALKGLLWLILSIFVYSAVTGLLDFLKGPQANDFFCWLITLILILIGFRYCLSLLPGPIGRAVRKIGMMILRLLSLIVIRLLKALWALLK